MNCAVRGHAYTPDLTGTFMLLCDDEPTVLEGLRRLFSGAGALVYAAAALVLLLAVRRALAGDPAARFTKLEALVAFAVACAAFLVPLHAVVAPKEDWSRSCCRWGND